jgi:hypothetical protein
MTGRAIIGTHIPCGFSRPTAPETRRSGGITPILSRPPRVISEEHQMFRIAERQRPQQNALNQRENCRRRVNSQSLPKIRQMLEHGIEPGRQNMPEVDTRVVQTVETALNHVSFAFRSANNSFNNNFASCFLASHGTLFCHSNCNQSGR